MKFLSKYTAQIIIFVVALYLAIPFFAPVAFKLGWASVGNAINEFYVPLCHQRVERSIFLFGKDYRYSIKELRDVGYLPVQSPNEDWPGYYGHGYVGDSEIGYKIPLCIRDIALYGGFVISSIILLFVMRGRKLNIKSSVIWALSIPMAVDVLLATVIEDFDLRWVPLSFVDSWSRRILTGFLFGLAMALLVMPLTYDDLLTKKQ